MQPPYYWSCWALLRGGLTGEWERVRNLDVRRDFKGGSEEGSETDASCRRASRRRLLDV